MHSFSSENIADLAHSGGGGGSLESSMIPVLESETRLSIWFRPKFKNPPTILLA